MASASSVLHILKNGETIRSLKVDSEAVIGRAEGCAVRLEDRAISRQHAVFRVISGGLQVERKSDYGQLLLNGADCSQALLKDGDILTVGPYLVRVQIQKDAPAAAAPAAEAETSPPSVVESSQTMVLESGVEEAGSDPEPDPELQSEPQSEPEHSSSESSESSDDFSDPDSDGHTKFTPAVGLTVKLLFSPGTANVDELELTKDEVSVGRGSGCDVILNDKKASRKHAIIRRSGLSFVIKDLGSANGTFVNGIKIEEQELSGDDSITIGDVSFQFQALSADYINQQNDFLKLEDQQLEPDTGGMDLGEAGALALSVSDESPMVPVSAENGGSGTLSGIPGIATPGSFGKEKKGFIDNLRNWKNLPLKQKVIVGVIAAGLVYFIFIDDEDEHELQVDPQQKVAAKQAGGKRVPASFAMLTPEQKRFIDAQYNLSFDHFQNKDFDKAIYEIQKIFALVEDYKNARELERYSKDGKRKVEAIEEEKKRKAREDQIKARIQSLVDETRELMKKKEYAPARELFAQILSIDPDNKDVVTWKNDIRSWEDQKAAEEQVERIRAGVNQKAGEYLEQGLALRSAGKCHDALEVYDQGLVMKPTDVVIAKKLGDAVEGCKRLIAKLRNPVLRAAKRAEGAKEYARAYKLFERVSRIDPPHPAGPAGMARVRGKLHEIAKTAFAEAVVAEGYSDLTRARKLYEEIVKTAPHDDAYYHHAIRRLSRYGVLDRDDTERAAAQAAAQAAAAQQQAQNPDPNMPGAMPGAPTDTVRAPAAADAPPADPSGAAPASDGVPEAPNLGGES